MIPSRNIEMKLEKQERKVRMNSRPNSGILKAHKNSYERMSYKSSETHDASESEKTRLRSSSRSHNEVKHQDMELRRSPSSRGHSRASGHQKNSGGDLETDLVPSGQYRRSSSRYSAESGRSASQQRIDDIPDDGKSRSRASDHSTRREGKTSELRVSRSDSRRRNETVSRSDSRRLHEAVSRSDSRRRNETSSRTDSRRRHESVKRRPCSRKSNKSQNSRPDSGTAEQTMSISGTHHSNVQPEKNHHQDDARYQDVESRSGAHEFRNLCHPSLPVSDLRTHGVARLREALQREIDRRSRYRASPRIRKLSRAFSANHPSSQNTSNLRRHDDYEGMRTSSGAFCRSYAVTDSGAQIRASGTGRSAFRAGYGSVTSDNTKQAQPPVHANQHMTDYPAPAEIESQLGPNVGSSGPMDLQSSRFTGYVQNLRNFFEHEISCRTIPPKWTQESKPKPRIATTSGKRGNNMATSGFEDGASADHVRHMARRMDYF